MSYPTPNTKVKIRKLTGIEWTQSQIRLSDGEPGFDTTNNILKIGFGDKLWSDLQPVNGYNSASSLEEYENPPLAVTGLAATSTNGSNWLDIKWNYPAQRVVGFLPNPIPLLVSLNARITYGDPANLSIFTIPVSSIPQFISRTNPITNIRLYGSSGTSGVVSTVPPYYAYYNINLLSMTGSPRIEVWYSNYSLSFNKVSVSLGSYFTIAQGPPSSPRFVGNVFPQNITHKLVVTFNPPLYANDTTRLDILSTITKYDISIRYPNPSNPSSTLTFVSDNIIGGTTPLRFGTLTSSTTNNLTTYVYTTTLAASQYTQYTILITATNNYGYFSTAQNIIDSGSLVSYLPPSIPTNISASISLGTTNADPKKVIITCNAPSTLLDQYDTSIITYTPYITGNNGYSALTITPRSSTTIPSAFSVDAFVNTTYTYYIIASTERGGNSAIINPIPTYTVTPALFTRIGPTNSPVTSATINDLVSPIILTFTSQQPTVYNINDSSETTGPYTYSIVVTKTPNGTTIPQAITPIFTSARQYYISNPDSNTTYTYTFNVVNSHSTVSSRTVNTINTGTLIYKSAPSVPRSLSISQYGTTGIRFNFIAPLLANNGIQSNGTYDTTSSILSYIITITKEGSPNILNNLSVLVANLQSTTTNSITTYYYELSTSLSPYTRYGFSLRAVNNYGLSSLEVSDPGTFSTDSLVEPGPPGDTGAVTINQLGFETLTPTLRFSFIGAQGNYRSPVDRIAITNYTFRLYRVSTLTPTATPTTTDYVLGTSTSTFPAHTINATANTRYTYSIISTNAYPSGNTTTTNYTAPTDIFIINALVPRGPPGQVTVSDVSVSDVTPSVVVMYDPSATDNTYYPTDHPGYSSFTITGTTSSGINIPQQIFTVGTPPEPTPYSFVLQLYQNVTYSFNIIARNNYQQTSTRTETAIIPRAPPGQITGITYTSLPPLATNSPPRLRISWSAPQYNSYFSNASGNITYTITFNSGISTGTFTVTSGNLFYDTDSYAGQNYSGFITARNEYALSSNTSFSNTVPALADIAALLTVSPLDTNAFYPTASRTTQTGSNFSIVDSNITTVLRTSTNAIATGYIPIGSFSISGSVNTTPITFTRSSLAGTYPLISNATNIGSFVARTNATDYDAGSYTVVQRFYMPDNTITVNVTKAIFSPDYNPKYITFLAERGSSAYSAFYVSVLTNTSTLPSTSSSTLTVSPSGVSTVMKSGYAIYPTLTFTGALSATELGDYFFPTDWVARVLINNTSTGSPDSYQYSITDLTYSSSTFNLDRPQFSRSLYQGNISGTVQFKNLNGTNTQTTLSNSDSRFNSSVRIDNASYSFSPSNHISTIIPSPAGGSAGAFTAYNHASVDNSTMLIYNGLFRTPGNLSASVRSSYGYPTSGPIRYVTFGFVVGGGNRANSQFTITINGLTGTTFQNGCIRLDDGSPLIVYYRFETQYSYAGVDYRNLISGGSGVVNLQPDGDSNYTTKWITANDVYNSPVTSSNYNTSGGAYYGNQGYSGNTMICFQPLINRDANPQPVYLYITIGAPSSTSFAFSGVSNSFG